MGAEADVVVEAELGRRALRRLIAARRGSLMLMKLVDFMMFSRASRILILDSDVLFFAPPRELLEAATAIEAYPLFMRDPKDNFDISPGRARELLGVEMATRINAGLALVPRACVDLSRCDDYLKLDELATPSGLTEQTLYALSAGETTRHLPNSYSISLNAGDGFEGLVARHYAGSSRPLLTSEGIPYLVARGFVGRTPAAAEEFDGGGSARLHVES
jgi:hypothetical protein